MYALRRRLLLAAVAMICVAPAQAVVLIDTDFSSADGYVDGKLQFQSPNGSGNGIWLGQFNNPDDADGGTGNPSVNATEGTVNVITSGPPAGDAFFRNLWSLGATGGIAGGDGSGELGAGFNLGDVINIEYTYQFEIGDGDLNDNLFLAGVTDCFITCSGGAFEAAPKVGIEAGYSEFEDGSVKFFTNFARSSTNGADNAFGIIVPAPDLGVDSGFSGNPVDLVSDNFKVSYSAELIDDVTDTWQPTELVIFNEDTQTELARASVDNPDALESFEWNLAGVGDSTSGTSDMFFASSWTLGNVADGSATASAVRFEYLPAVGPSLPGDYSGNGVVDAADYTVWRDTEGTFGGGLAADGTGDDLLGVPDGDVDQFDYDFWASKFGESASATAVPEPTGLGLTMILVGLGVRLTRRL